MGGSDLADGEPALRLRVVGEETKAHLHGADIAWRVPGRPQANDVPSCRFSERQSCYKDIIRNQLCHRTGPLGSRLVQLHWSGRRDSNPRPSPWEGDALPLSYFRRLTSFFAFIEFLEFVAFGEFSLISPPIQCKELYPLNKPNKLW